MSTRMMDTFLLALLAILALSLSACSSDGGSPQDSEIEPLPDTCEPLSYAQCECPIGVGMAFCNDDGDGYGECQCAVKEAEPKAEVVQVDEQAKGLVVREDRDGISIPLEGNEAIADMQPGEVIWSWEASWGGKIQSIEQRDGRIYLELEDVPIGDLFDKLVIRYNGTMNMAAFMPEEAKQLVRQRMKARLKKENDDGGDGGLPAGLSFDVEGDLDIGVEVLPESYIDLNVDVYFALDFDSKLSMPVKNFILIPHADIDMNLATKIDVKAAGSANADLEFVELMMDASGWGELYPPWIPIPNTNLGLETYLHIGCTLELDAKVKAEPTLSIQGYALAGFAYSKDWSDYDFSDAPKAIRDAKKQWKNETWESMADYDFQADAQLNDDKFKWGAHGGVECYLKPVLALTYARSVGATLSEKMYARFDAYVGDKNMLTVTAGANVYAGGKVSIFGFKTVWEDEWEVFGFSRELWRYSWLRCGDGYRNLECDSTGNNCSSSDCPDGNCDLPAEECDAGEWANVEGQPSPWRPTADPAQRCVPPGEPDECTCGVGWVPVDSTPIEDFPHDWRWGHGNNWCMPSCGNGIWEEDEGEVCDDGNTMDWVGDCAADCKSTQKCGDGVIQRQMGEVCDDGNTVGGDGCNQWCTGKEKCGDGIVDHAAGEECDDQNTNDCDRCSNNCQLVTGCGDGAVCGDEECDDGNYFDCDGCDRCVIHENYYCGDGLRCGNERCDDGNDDNCDACNTNCVQPSCGDGFRCGNEVCDDGNTAGGDGCNYNCTGTEECGDGVPDFEAGEQCDDGNDDDCDSCHNDCTTFIDKCGDGHVCRDEVCDDGNYEPGDGCSTNCMSDETCGNNVVDAINEEQCDDGNHTNGDGCSANCLSDETCGNGITDAYLGEVCDDGNQYSGDGCRGDCLGVEECGDGLVDYGEQCEDTSVDGVDEGCWESAPDCRSGCGGCEVRCGDGVIGTGESCDINPDGIDFGCDAAKPICGSNCDACEVDCSDNICGDGKVCGDEVCDDGNTEDCVGECSADCMHDITGCGDSIVCGDEVCDDGNTASGDGCRSDCAGEEECGDGLLDVGESCEDSTVDGIDMNCTEGSPDCVSECGGCTPRCGDGVIGPGEGCEDTSEGGQDLGCDAGTPVCRGTCDYCVAYVCGDGFVNEPEVCDGEPVACTEPETGYAGMADCVPNCLLVGACVPTEFCGDGTTNGNEACDDADNDSCTRACSADCMHENLPETPTCGDGILECGEVCDDSGIQSGDGCSHDCLSDETCGNNYVDTAAGEQCDDGNTTGEDGCSADCTSDETCGNHKVDAFLGEVCDDGNTDDCLGDCAADCESWRDGAVCGDDTYDNECEVCEDSDPTNQTVDDGCTPEAPNCNNCQSCTGDVCGDGIVGSTETCDEGGQCTDVEETACSVPDTSPCLDPEAICRPFGVDYPDGSVCSINCQYSMCGDGQVTGEEGCDDSDPGTGIDLGCAESAPLCTSDCSGCRSEICWDGLVTGNEVCEDSDPTNESPDDGCTELFPHCVNSCYTCQNHICGDGQVTGDELCDDTNPDQSGIDDGCTESAPLCYDACTQCVTKICGDGYVTGDEPCDRRDLDGDGIDPGCTAAAPNCAFFCDTCY